MWSWSWKKGALAAIAQKAIDRQIGARGLRAVMEEIMTKIMYEIPSDLTIQKVLITEDCVRGGQPRIIRMRITPPEPGPAQRLRPLSRQYRESEIKDKCGKGAG